jgi:hypothetical protein
MWCCVSAISHRTRVDAEFISPGLDQTGAAPQLCKEYMAQPKCTACLTQCTRLFSTDRATGVRDAPECTASGQCVRVLSPPWCGSWRLGRFCVLVLLLRHSVDVGCAFAAFAVHLNELHCEQWEVKLYIVYLWLSSGCATNR